MVEQLDPQVAQPAADTSTTPEGPEAVDAGWTPPPPASANEARFRDWIAQLQTMIDGVATAAAPHVREIAAKAAELAAKAGDAAGPVAKKAAGVTSDVGQKVAAKSRDFAADMRRMTETETDAPANGNGQESGPEATAEPTAPKSTEPAAEKSAQTPFTEG
ncbi:MAG: hypothetical protein M3P84_09590 [Chloroflexota bacterium]|nr:hypothetical protein [Chloroflexota bacterium]